MNRLMPEFPARAELTRRAAAAGVELRFGREELLDDLEPLWRAMLAHHVQVRTAQLATVDQDTSWQRRRHLYAGLLADPEAVIVTVSRDGRAVGYCVAHIREGADDTWATGDRVGVVESLAVVAAERGRGLGTLLLDATEAYLAARGARDVTLAVMAGNDRAMAFYASRGMTATTVNLFRLGPASRPS